MFILYVGPTGVIIIAKDDGALQDGGTTCIFQPYRGSRRTEPGRKDSPGNPKCFCRKFGHFLSTTPKTWRAGGITSANGNLSIPPNASAFPSAYPSDTLTHNQPKPQPCTVDFATRKKMPLSLHTRISSALMKGLLASFILVVAADAAHNPALTHEENIKAALGDWERGLSGKPINCRRFVDLFIDDGVWSSPAGARNKLAPDMSSKSTLSLLLASQIGDLCVECH